MVLIEVVQPEVLHNSEMPTNADVAVIVGTIHQERGIWVGIDPTTDFVVRELGRSVHLHPEKRNEAEQDHMEGVHHQPLMNMVAAIDPKIRTTATTVEATHRHGDPLLLLLLAITTIVLIHIILDGLIGEVTITIMNHPRAMETTDVVETGPGTTAHRHDRFAKTLRTVPPRETVDENPILMRRKTAIIVEGEAAAWNEITIVAAVPAHLRAAVSAVDRGARVVAHPGVDLRAALVEVAADRGAVVAARHRLVVLDPDEET